MKKLSLLFAFTCLFTIAFAQGNRTIEVTVTDTVFLKTTQIKYILTLDTTMNMWGMYEDEMYYDMEEYMEYEYEPEPDKKQRRRKTEETEIIEERVEEREVPLKIAETESKPESTYFSRLDVIEMLNKHKFEYVVYDHLNYELGGELPSGVTFLLTLNNEEDLNRLFTLFSGHEEINGKVKELVYESLENKLTTTYKDLYDKALKEVMIIAKISGLTVDKVSKVYEQKGELDSYMDSYQEIMNNLPYGIKEPMNFKGREKVVKRSFVFDVK